MSDATTNSTGDTTGRKRGLAKVGAELVGLSPWKKKLLSLFLIVASIGGVMWTQATLTTRGKAEVPKVEIRETESADATAAEAMPSNARGMFAETSPQNAPVERIEDTEAPVEADAEAERVVLPWHGRLGGWMARLGISFAVGLIVGVFFRTFLKTMAAITAVAVGALAAASWFNVLDVVDVDFDAMRDNYDSAAGWAKGQVGALKDLVVNFLPSATASGLGFFSGFLRK